MKSRLLMAVLAVGLGAGAGAIAEEKTDHPRISFVGQGASRNPTPEDQVVKLVVEGPFLSYDKTPIPDAGVVEYVNGLLKSKGASYIAVYPREGAKYGDVVHAVDVLRKTDAKNIGVSLSVLAAGREP